MALSKPKQLTKISISIPIELKARLDAVEKAAKDQGYEFSFEQRLAASLSTILTRDERVLGVGKFDDAADKTDVDAGSNK